MSVWFVIPSARPAAEVGPVLAKWAERGYRIAIQRDNGKAVHWEWALGLQAERPYLGYAEAVNFLAAKVLDLDPDCDWIVAAGDDTEPDPNKTADEIAAELTAHFAGTFGVMQPTGDSWSDHQGKLIERVAGSPWLGREWCLRANQGKGPFWPNFYHMFADETLQCVASQLGVFWQRPDLTHYHQHWARPKEGKRLGDIKDMPDFLRQANSPEEWSRSKAEFERLKAEGFKECLPL